MTLAQQAATLVSLIALTTAVSHGVTYLWHTRPEYQAMIARDQHSAESVAMFDTFIRNYRWQEPLREKRINGISDTQRAAIRAFGEMRFEQFVH